MTSRARLDGFRAAVDGKLTVSQTVDVNEWSRSEALTRAEEIMRANPDLAGFFVANDDMGLGVSRAVQNAGKSDQVRVVSVDGVEDGLRAVKSGQLAATVAQYPYTIGEMGVEACRAAAAGHTLPATVNAPVALVTQDNAADALSAFPKPFEQYDDPYRQLLQQ